jgi:hypothetical protein
MANKIIYINNKKATINGSWLMLDPGLRVLTLHTVGNGTVTASQLSGYPGETAIITPTYETYNRFSGYELSGPGSIQDNIYTFGNDNADLSAVFKPNAFTAVGSWEKGSNITASNGYGDTRSTAFPAKYAIFGSVTGEIPNSWHNTSNRWKPSNASAYSITLHPKIGITTSRGTGASTTAKLQTVINGGATNSQSFINSNGTYEKTITSNVQSNYYVNGTFTCHGYYNGYYNYAYIYYNTANNVGTWTATGYAP